MRRLVLPPLLSLFLSTCGKPVPPPEVAVEFGPPPPTRIGPVADTLHGEIIPDPYRWLEDGESPETRAWIDAQNAYTDAIFAQLPYREELKRLVTSLERVDLLAPPVEKGGRYFYGKRRAEEDRMVVYYRDGLDGEEHLLVDPRDLSEDPSIRVSVPQAPDCPLCRTALRRNDISADGTLMVYALGQGGASAEHELRIRNVDVGRDLRDVFPPAVYWSVRLTPDNAGLYYSVRNTEAPRVWYHALGTDVSEDQEVFGAGYGVADIPYLDLSPDGRWLLAGAWRGDAGTFELYLKDLESDTDWIEISTEGMTTGGFAGDKLLLTTTVGVEPSPVPTPKRRVVVADLANPQAENWVELLPASEDKDIRGAAGIGGYYFVAFIRDGRPGVTQYDTAGNLVREIAFGTIGSVFGPDGEWDKKEAIVDFTSFHVPWTVYRINVDTGRTEVWFGPEVPVDPESVEIEQVHFTSMDGRTFPMFIVHEKGLELDGDRPTFLTGYPNVGGGYAPVFWPEVVLFMKMGGVFAVARPRGSDAEAVVPNDFGNASNDFIAAAEYLIEEGYTRPERLALMGRSFGGLLVADAVIRRPDLFGAVECRVPLTDMIRYHRFPGMMHALSMFGSSENPEQFHYIRQHSPYHNALEGTQYPATVFVTSDDDPNVNPLHARKMTAMVQATNGGENPIMLRHHLRAGHGGRLPLDEDIEETVDLWAFYWWRVGGG